MKVTFIRPGGYWLPVCGNVVFVSAIHSKATSCIVEEHLPEYRIVLTPLSWIYKLRKHSPDGKLSPEVEAEFLSAWIAGEF